MDTNSTTVTSPSWLQRGLGHLRTVLGPVGAVLIITSVLTLIVGGGNWLGALIKAGLGFVFILLHLGTRPRGPSNGFRMRLWRLRASDGLWLLGFTVFTVALNVAAARSLVQWDVSESQVHSLSEETVALLHTLTVSVEVLAFVDAADKRRENVKARLAQWEQASTFVHTRLLDPNLHPDLLKQFSMRSDTPPVVVRISPNTENTSTFQRANFGEASIALAIYRLSRNDPRKIYIIENPGQNRLHNIQAEGLNRAAQRLKEQGLEVASLSLAALAQKNYHAQLQTKPEQQDDPQEGLQLPHDAAALVLPSVTALTPIDIRTLQNYLSHGGRLLVLLDAAQNESTTNTKSAPLQSAAPTKWLRPWKVHARDDIVVDSIGQVYGLGWSGPFIQPRRNHKISDGLDGMMVFKTARTLQPLKGGLPHVLCDVVAETTRSAFAETMLIEGKPHQDPQDLVGPLPVAIACADRTNELDEGLGGGRLVVVGDSDFLTNRFIGQQRNAEFFLRSISWLVERDTPFSVQAHQRAASQMALTPQDLNAMRMWTLDFMPVLFIAYGAVVVTLRRRQTNG